jgi:hypothetical protein
MSHFQVQRLNWKKEDLPQLSKVLQSLASQLGGTHGTSRTVENQYEQKQFMQSFIEFPDMAPIGLVLTSEPVDGLALCFDNEQAHGDTSVRGRMSEMVAIITSAFGEYRGKLAAEQLLKASSSSNVHINVSVKY